jgi:4-hydroxy-4-methyl-2-oxoglutarate aldolase
MTNSEELNRIFDLLKAAGVSTVYEAAGRTGGMAPEIRPIADGQLIAGRALTVRCHHGDNFAVHRAVAEAQPGDVLVVDGGGVIVGYWGEVLTAAARHRGIAGLVIDGGVRDIGPIRKLGFPIWSRGVSMRSAMKTVPGEIGIPIVCAEVAVETGDWVLGDDDGVTIVKAAELDAVAEQTSARMAKEAGYLERIAEGVTTLELFNLR